MEPVDPAKLPALLPAGADPSQLEHLIVEADRSAMQATLLRGLLHDLSGHLQTITLAAHVGGMMRNDVAAASDRVFAHMGWMTSLSGGLFQRLRPEAGPTSIRDVAAFVARAQQSQRGLTKVAFETRIPPDLPAVIGTDEDIAHAILSMVRNAKESVGERPDGKVWLTAELDDGWLSLAVEDNGAGIPESLHERVFEPFFTTKDSPSALGLGLCAARILAARYGGEVRVERPSGSGARVVMRLRIWSAGN